MDTLYQIEETARLVLIDLPVRSVAMFVRETRDYHADAPLGDLQMIWTKYMGLDGRVSATHDLYTGNELSTNKEH